ncbi:hypothetical protein BS78_01G012000 [Paspalum vaginatum]|nr:hypothetical protein BS78_01G012000 [Paspalum vaginatum]
MKERLNRRGGRRTITSLLNLFATRHIYLQLRLSAYHRYVHLHLFLQTDALPILPSFHSISSICTLQPYKQALPLPTHLSLTGQYTAQHMKDRRRGSVPAFPFSMGCMSQFAVSVADPAETSKKPPQTQSEQPSSSSSVTAAAAQHQGSEGGVVVGDSSSSEAAKEASPGPGLVATGVSRLMKGIRSLSQMFAAPYDGEEDEDEEREMVIGYPTDVQHVGHIGWDGGQHTKLGATAMGMLNAFSLPSTLSLRQLEMAMDHHHHHAAAQASA